MKQVSSVLSKKSRTELCDGDECKHLMQSWVLYIRYISRL